MFPQGLSRIDEEQASPQLDRELVGVFVAGVAVGPRLSQTHPAVFEAGPQAELPAGWEQRADRKSARIFFVNHNLRTTCWADPRAPKETVDARSQGNEGAADSDDDDDDDDDYGAAHKNAASLQPRAPS